MQKKKGGKVMRIVVIKIERTLILRLKFRVTVSELPVKVYGPYWARSIKYFSYVM